MDCYDREGRPISMEEWARLREQGNTVAKDDIITKDGRTVLVSTIWLGMDHRFGDDGPPLIFETMVFEQGMAEELCWRYSTEKEAKDGHDMTVHVLQVVGLKALIEDRGVL